MKQVTLKVNGVEHVLLVDPHNTLAHVLREQLNLTGTKIGCEEGECGACTVMLNGQAVTSCIVPIMKAEGKEITTIEGLASNGKLHPIQDKFIEHGAIQCGFCTPGIVMHSKAYLDKHGKVTEEGYRSEVLTGHVCRCTGYQQMVDAMLDAAEALEKEGK